MSDATLDEVIRRVERGVLDTYHSTFGLPRYAQESSVESVLTVYCNSLHHLQGLPPESLTDTEFTSYLRVLENGAMQALRWILAESSIERESNVPDLSIIAKETIEFMTWGASYKSLATDHIAWSRGVLSGSADIDKKQITFKPKSEYDLSFFLGQTSSWQKWIAYVDARRPLPALSRICAMWTKSMRRDQRSIDIDPDFAVRTEENEAVVRWTRNETFPGAAPAFDLGAYTFEDFCRVYAAIFIHSWCINEFENDYARTHGKENDWGSAPFVMPMVDASNWFAAASDIPVERVRAILNQLTFNASSIHSSFAFQPLIQTREGTLAFSPGGFCRGDPYRMLAGSLNVGERRRYYETLVGPLEQSRVDQIAASFKSRGFIALPRQTLTGADGSGTPDLLVYSPKDGEVLVVEYKHSISPPEPAMVANRLREVDGWVTKLITYRRLLLEDKMLKENTGICASVERTHLLLLYGFPMLIPVGKIDEVAMGDWVSLAELVTQAKSFSLSGLWHWAKRRPDVAHLTRAATYAEQRIPVGDWTYIRSVIGLASANY